MQSSITLPQLTDGLVDATVVRWLKNPGDGFSAGDVLVELEIDNALVHLEASRPGKLVRVMAEPRQTVKVGAALAEIEPAEAAATQAKPAKAAKGAKSAKAAKTTKPAKPVEEPPAAAVVAATAAPAAPPAATAAPAPTAGSAANATPILMPQAGNTMEEGILVAWKVSEGDQIQLGQIICEIETDKATIEYESPAAGRLARIVARENDAIPVKEPIAVLADHDADADAFLAARGGGAVVAAAAAGPASPAAATTAGGAAVATASRAPSTPSPTTAQGRIKASPAARKIAAQRGVDLARVGPGSGPAGRILSLDVERAGTAALAAGDGQPQRRPMPKMRRAIGLNLQRSKQTIPHFYLRMTIEATQLLAHYRDQKPRTGCTINDCIVLATGRAMAEFPAVRSQIVGDEIVEYPHANIGIAVGVEHGLVVPVVCQVDQLSLAQLAAEAKRVVENARNGKLSNIGQGNFTITNLGMFGVEEFSAIINPPESGILAVSAARESVIVDNGAIRAGRVMTLTLSTDHRIVDGMVAAQFLGRLKEILQQPGETLT